MNTSSQTSTGLEVKIASRPSASLSQTQIDSIQKSTSEHLGLLRELLGQTNASNIDICAIDDSIRFKINVLAYAGQAALVQEFRQTYDALTQTNRFKSYIHSMNGNQA